MPRSSEPHAGPGRLAALEAAAERLPLYRSLPAGRTRFVHTADDLRRVATDLADPFGGRHDEAHPPDAVVQVARDLPVYWTFTGRDLRDLASLTAAWWREVGVSPGDRIAFYDYATSPAVLFASRSYIAHLEAGAADILGCLPICNDGLPELAERCVHILEYVKPPVLFVDVELMDPLLRALETTSITGRPARVVVTGDEAPVSSRRLQAWGDALGAEVTQMLRVDPALFMAPPCPVLPGTFHPDETAYRVEMSKGEGALMVTNLAVRSTVVVRYLASLFGSIVDGPCSCGRAGSRIVIESAA